MLGYELMTRPKVWTSLVKLQVLGSSNCFSCLCNTLQSVTTGFHFI